MKKTTRVLVALLALTLVTSCFVGGTFAKYIVSDSANDSARVAKFGVTIDATSEAFAAEYTDTTNGLTVKASEKVVAPGTSGDLAALEIAGTPEVAVNVTRNATVTLTGWELANGDEYCPLVFKVDGTEVKIDGVNITSVADLEDALEDAIALAQTRVEAGNAVDFDTAITWEWPFYVDDANDVKDTYLGDQAALGNAAEIAIALDATVVQID